MRLVRLGASVVVSMDSLELAVAGRLSGLEEPLSPPESLEGLFLDLKTPLRRSTGEVDLLLDCETGGARPEVSVDPEGSSSRRVSVVDEYCEGSEPW